MLKSVVSILSKLFLIFIHFANADFRTTTLKSISLSMFNGYYEESGSIDIGPASSSIVCLQRCLANDDCVTFFYNHITGKCILHSKLVFLPHSSGTGWSYYLTRDVSGRCPGIAILHRRTDFCYTGGWRVMEYGKLKSICSGYGGNFITVKSLERQTYLQHILSERPYPKVCIDGNKHLDGSWTFDDGTPMTYFNWYPGEPSSILQLGIILQTCLEMYTNDQWFDVECISSDKCIYLCEFEMA